MTVNFYTHDTYLDIRRKFTGAWMNLRIEMSQPTPSFVQESGEFGDEARFFPDEAANELILTLTGDIRKGNIRKLFADSYGSHGTRGGDVETYVFGNLAQELYYPSEDETLDECNRPFILPLDRYYYADFQRLFTAKWTNLSVEVYQKSAVNTELQELERNFQMKNLTRLNSPMRGDYYELLGVRTFIEKRTMEAAFSGDLFLSTLAGVIEDAGLIVRIKNEKLGIFAEGKLANLFLKDFQAAENLEVLQKMVL